MRSFFVFMCVVLTVSFFACEGDKKEKQVNPAVQEAQQVAAQATDQARGLGVPEEKLAQVQTSTGEETKETGAETEAKGPGLWKRFWDGKFANSWYGQLIIALAVLAIFVGLLVLFFKKLLDPITDWVKDEKKKVRHIREYEREYEAERRQKQKEEEKESEEGGFARIAPIVLMAALFSLFVSVAPLLAGDKLSKEDLVAITLANTQSVKATTASIEQLKSELAKIKTWMSETEGYSGAYMIEREANAYTDKSVKGLARGKDLNDLKKQIGEVDKRIALAFDPTVLLKAAGFSQESIDAFQKLDPVKPDEAALREAALVAALQKLAMPNWSTPEAQKAIQLWVEQNMLDGKKLEEVMGINATGKVNTDAVALLGPDFWTGLSRKLSPGPSPFRAGLILGLALVRVRAQAAVKAS